MIRLPRSWRICGREKLTKVEEIMHYDVDEMIDVYRLQQIKIKSAKDSIAESIRRQALLVKAIMVKEGFNDYKKTIEYINSKIKEK